MSKKPVLNKFESILQFSNRLVVNSHISFESALYFHGLINKIPNEILAVGYTKKCTTSLGIFRYIGLRDCLYPKGVQKISAGNGGIIMIASKEKAIADILVRRSTPKFTYENEVESFLIDEVGVCKKDLMDLNDNELINLRISYNKLNVRLLARLYSETDGGRIWVADFSKTATENDLLKLFRPFGEALSIKIRQKPLANPIAFISMKNPLDGKEAIRHLHRRLFQGKSITVKESNEEMMSQKYVYALLSFDKKECYVGETCDPKRRFKQHLSGKGDASSSPWISTLNTKPKPVILEAINASYDSDFQAIFFETVWRFVASRWDWEVFNFPYLSGTWKELEVAIESRMNRWPVILKEVIG